MKKDLRLALMTAIDIPITECQLILHQPTIQEISYLGDTVFFTGVQTLCLNKSMFIQDNVDSNNINNFQVFLMIMKEKEMADKKKAVRDVLSLIFPNYNIVFSPQSILFTKDKITSIVDETNFDILQETLRKVFCSSNGPMDQQAFNPADEAAKAIAQKIMEGREKIAKEKGQNNSSVFVQYLSILSIALQISIKELSQYSMFQFYDAIERYSLWINWDLDVRTRLAGGKPDHHPDNWMKNIH